MAARETLKVENCKQRKKSWENVGKSSKAKKNMAKSSPEVRLI